MILEILQQPSKHAQPIGRIVEVLGNYADPGMEIEIALRKHDLPNEFPHEAKKQAEAFSPEVKPSDYAGRESVVKLPLVTIDGETARDFDDAVYCEPNGKGFRPVVAIADVSSYVQSGDALDKEAINRGNSVYFPRRVIPMLPEELSNGLCSLNPNVERLCMVCDMQISASGDILQHRFYPSVMFSHARLTYTRSPTCWPIHRARMHRNMRKCCRTSTTCTSCSRPCCRHARSAEPSISKRSRRR